MALRLRISSEVLKGAISRRLAGSLIDAEQFPVRLQKFPVQQTLIPCSLTARSTVRSREKPVFRAIQDGEVERRLAIPCYFPLLAGNYRREWFGWTGCTANQPYTLFSRTRRCKFARHFRQLGRLEVNSSGPFCPQFAVCGVLRAFSLPLTFWHLPNVMLKHRASCRMRPESRGDGLISVGCLLEEPEARRCSAQSSGMSRFIRSASVSWAGWVPGHIPMENDHAAVAWALGNFFSAH